MKAEHINPFIASTVEVFATMLKCKLTRGELSASNGFQPAHDVSGVIGLTGNAAGTVVVSLDRNMAISAAEAMLGVRPEALDRDVTDAVGELTNMIAGRAKSQLEHLSMKLALPTVITGKNHVIRFGSAAQTICIPYECAWGELTLEIGLEEMADESCSHKHCAAT